MRTVDDVTDDELVEEVARFGTYGLHIDSWYEGTFRRVCRRLQVIDVQTDNEEACDIEAKVVTRMRDLIKMGRLQNRPRSEWSRVVTLTAGEWGRRLAGKSAEEIASALNAVGGNNA